MEGKKRNSKKYYWKNGEKDMDHLSSPSANRHHHETRPTTTVIGIHQWVYVCVVAASFFLGWFLGHHHHQPAATAASSTSVRSSGSSSIHSFVRQYDELPTRDTAHTDNGSGRPITKRQFLDPFAVPTVAGISVATIEPGQTVAMHSHTTMHEFFYVLEGSAVFRVEGNEDGNGQNQEQEQQYHVRPGSFAYFSPPDRHEIHVAADSPDGDLKVLLVGVVVE